MVSIQPRSWHRLTLAAVAGGGIALSAILAVQFSNTQIEVLIPAQAAHHNEMMSPAVTE